VVLFGPGHVREVEKEVFGGDYLWRDAQEFLDECPCSAEICHS